MGLYINPENQTKEEWLTDHGTEIPREVFASFNFDNDQLPVCLVDTGSFTAAGIADGSGERDRMLEGYLPVSRQRPKRYFLVDRADLAPWMKGG